MNYVIMCQPRSGSSYLGELLQLMRLPYFNELFTPEICRTSRLWPADLERRHVDNRIDLAFSVPGGGFKLPYPYQDSISATWALARLATMPHVIIIHLIRDDQVEAFASWLWLNRAGISMARDDGSQWNTDGLRVDDLKQQPPFTINPQLAVEWFRAMALGRAMVQRLFRWHRTLEVKTAEVFTPEGQQRIIGHLGIPRREYKQPNQIKTPRPKAREMLANFADVAAAFNGTEWERAWREADAIP